MTHFLLNFCILGPVEEKLVTPNSQQVQLLTYHSAKLNFMGILRLKQMVPSVLQQIILQGPVCYAVAELTSYSGAHSWFI